MRYHRGIMAVTICLFCVTVPSMFSGAVIAKNKPVRTIASAQHSEKSTQLERMRVVRRLKKTINSKRKATWRVQVAVHKPHTRTSYAERKVNSPAFLRWEARLWNRRLLAVKRYAKSIFS